MLSAERHGPPHTLRVHVSSPGRRVYVGSFPPRHNLHYQDYRGFPEALSSPPPPTPQPVYPPQQPLRLTGSLRSILKDEEEHGEPEFVLPPTPDKSVPINLEELSRSSERKIYEKYFKVLYSKGL